MLNLCVACVHRWVIRGPIHRRPDEAIRAARDDLDRRVLLLLADLLQRTGSR